MTAREYLLQYSDLESKIRDKKEQLRRLRELAGGISSPTALGTKSCNPSDVVGALTTKIIDLENEIAEEIIKLVKLRREIVSRIDALPNVTYGTILEKRFLGRESIMQVAEELQCSRETILRKQRKALEMFEYFCET